MATTTTQTIAPFSFMGLMAGEGLIPGTESSAVNSETTSVALENSVRELAKDINSADTFFTLMEEAGQMNEIKRARRSFAFKIVRPASLGGVNTGNHTGAFAH